MCILNNQFQQEPGQRTNTVTIKLSRDGARFSSSASYIFLHFLAWLVMCSLKQVYFHILRVYWQRLLVSHKGFLHAGNHTYVAVKGGESYPYLNDCLHQCGKRWLTSFQTLHLWLEQSSSTWTLCMEPTTRWHCKLCILCTLILLFASIVPLTHDGDEQRHFHILLPLVHSCSGGYQKSTRLVQASMTTWEILQMGHDSQWGHVQHPCPWREWTYLELPTSTLCSC